MPLCEYCNQSSPEDRKSRSNCGAKMLPLQDGDAADKR